MAPLQINVPVGVLEAALNAAGGEITTGKRCRHLLVNIGSKPIMLVEQKQLKGHYKMRPVAHGDYWMYKLTVGSELNVKALCSCPIKALETLYPPQL